ncbi:MAG: hypothetical protein MUO60_07695, partial [Clostridiaceae bacterium]|nr:hypothetical protein [Clostridiaceae bacterium]
MKTKRLTRSDDLNTIGYSSLPEATIAERDSEYNDLSDTELTKLFTKSLEANKKIRNQTKMN